MINSGREWDWMDSTTKTNKMKTPMEVMDEIVSTMELKAYPRKHQLLKLSSGSLKDVEEKEIRKAFEAGRNSIKGIDKEISKRKSKEYYNKRFR
jgi:Cys-tRNA synthase (O-phospho-L-seryl-tRNA:Cys-tRNA synthase)